MLKENSKIVHPLYSGPKNWNCIQVRGGKVPVVISDWCCIFTAINEKSVSKWQLQYKIITEMEGSHCDLYSTRSSHRAFSYCCAFCDLKQILLPWAPPSLGRVKKIITTYFMKTCLLGAVLKFGAFSKFSMEGYMISCKDQNTSLCKHLGASCTFPTALHVFACC